MPMSPVELSELLRTPYPPYLLDVRTEDENSFVSLPNSRLIPLHELERRWKEIESWKESPIVVYCHHGIRSERAAAFLRGCGFTQVENLDGGIDAWSSEIDPSVKSY